MKLSKLITCCMLIASSVFFSACSAPEPPVWSSKSTNDESIKKEQLYTVKKGSINIETSGIGMLVASRETNLYFNQVSGVLKKITIRVNNKVSKGDLVAEIESSELNEQLLQTELELEKNEIKLQQIDLSIDTNIKDIEITRIDLEYCRNLLMKEATQDNKDAYKKTQLRLKQYENFLANSRKEKEIVKLDIESLEISKNLVEQRLKDCRLISHIEGIVTFIENFSIGDYVPDNKIIGTLIEPRNMVLQFVSENLSEFTGGMDVIVKINGKEYSAYVYSPMPGDLIKDLDPNIKVKNQIYIKLDKPIEGMSLNEKAITSIYTKPRNNTLIIPRSALRSENSKCWVERYINGKLEKTEVIKGIESEASVEIRQGLNEGDIILRGY